MKIPPVSQSTLRGLVWAGIVALLLKLIFKGSVPWLAYVLDVVSTVLILGGAAGLVVGGRRNR